MPSMNRVPGTVSPQMSAAAATAGAPSAAAIPTTVRIQRAELMRDLGRSLPQSGQQVRDGDDGDTHGAVRHSVGQNQIAPVEHRAARVDDIRDVALALRLF